MGGVRDKGGEPKAGFSIHWNRKATIVCSWKYRKGHSDINHRSYSMQIVMHIGLYSYNF